MEQSRDQFNRFTSLFDSSSAEYDFIGKFLEEINTPLDPYLQMVMSYLLFSLAISNELSKYFLSSAATTTRTEEGN